MKTKKTCNTCSHFNYCEISAKKKPACKDHVQDCFKLKDKEAKWTFKKKDKEE